MSRARIHPPLGAAAWPVVREWAALDNLCLGIFDCPHTTPELTKDGPFVVRSQDVRSGVFRMDEAGHVSKATYRERIARAEPAYGDILYSREGTYFGNAAEVPPGVQVCLGQRMVLIKPRQELVDSRFLRFWLNSPILKDHIFGFRDGTVAERLNMPTIRNIPVPLVPIEEQKGVGEVLSALDDKIEVNRLINETLEAMAQAIFRDWFVDFGPVRRKLAGAIDAVEIMGGLTLDSARAAELVGLFPGKLKDDGLPDGWSETPLSDHLEIIGGGTPKTSVAEYWGGTIPWFSVVDTPSGSDIFVFNTEKSITAAGLAGSSARLIPLGTTIISARGTVGNLAIAAQDMTFNQSCYALRSARGEHTSFVYLATAHAVEQLRAMAHGSVFSTITRQTFDALTFPSSPLIVLDAFETVAAPLFHRVRAAVAENRSLAETRDYLLPRLMSGFVKIDKADQGSS